MLSSFNDSSSDVPSAAPSTDLESFVELSTALEIVRTLSSETVNDNLLSALMKAAFRHGGADRGLLVRLRDGNLRIEASALLDCGEVEVSLLQTDCSPSAGPLQVFRRVIETKQAVSIGDCAEGHPFSEDEYLRSSTVRCMLCLPLIRDVEVEGILFLEHNLKAKVFTPARRAVLDLVAAQGAQSLCNVELYAKIPRSDDWIRPALNTIPILVITRDCDGVADFHNQNWLDYTGLTADEARGDGWRVILHPEDAAQNAEQSQADIAAGRAGNYEARLRGRDGQYRWFSTYTVPLRGESGEIEKWYGACINIDDLKSEEQRARKSESFLNEAQRMTHCGSWTWDIQNNCFPSWSKEMFRILGCDPDTTSPTFELIAGRIHPEDLSSVDVGLEEIAAGVRAEFLSYFRIVDPDGKIRQMQVIAHPVINPKGDVIEIVGTTMDVNEQHLREQAIRESEEMLRLTVKTIPGLWSAAADGYVDSINGHYLSYRPADEAGELAAQSWLSRIHPEFVDEVTHQWNHAVATGEPFQAEFQRMQPDGAYRWFQSCGWPLRNSSGKIIRWYGLLVDMNEPHRREQEVQRLHLSLARAMRVATAGELAASIVHEVSQPVAAILSNAEASMHWLDEKTLNLPNARRDIGRIVRDANGAGDVMTRVRELFRRSAPVASPLNLTEIISEVLRLVQNELSKRQIAVQTDWQGNLPVVWGDRVQIQQVILNLLINAMDAMEGINELPRRVIVRLSQQSNEELLIEVRDQGIGVKDGNDVFESFFTTKDHGIGMGLSICKSIIEAHRGRIWMEPCESPGASFRFTLPVGRWDRS